LEDSSGVAAMTPLSVAVLWLQLTKMEDSSGVAAMAISVEALVIITDSGMSHCSTCKARDVK